MRNLRTILSTALLLGFLPVVTFSETPAGKPYDVCAEIKCDNVKNYLDQLQAAIKEDDKSAVASLMTYPLNVNEIKNGKVIHKKIKNQKDFVQQYDSLITETMKKSILKSNFKDSISNYQGIGIVGGKLWLVNDVPPIRTFAINIENRKTN